MSVTLALEHLYDGVVTLMAADAADAEPPVDPVPHTFGWREPARLATTSHRIVWVPGDDESGAVGSIGSARYPGRNPRPLATLHELFTVYVCAFDVASPEVERAQYKATRELFDAWYRAVHLTAHGTFAFATAPTWVRASDRAQRRHGGAIRIVGSIDAMIPDTPAAIAPVDTSALIDVTELDVTEQIEAAPGDPL